MSGKVAFVFAAMGIAVMIGTEIVRSIVHRRCERLHGIGGTQDIAMRGTFIGLAGICGLIWKLQH